MKQTKYTTAMWITFAWLMGLTFGVYYMYKGLYWNLLLYSIIIYLIMSFLSFLNLRTASEKDKHD